ncbi:MAG TPA: Cof-type HAD-IIB family hydrolase [Anaerolineales bacterium]
MSLSIKNKPSNSGSLGDRASIQLIAMDVDGTVLDSFGQPSPGIEKAIQAACSRGVQIVLVSGRGVQGVLPVADRLHLEGTVIASGGAVTASTPAGTLIDHRPISLSWAIKLARLGHAEGVVVFFEHPDWMLCDQDGRAMEDMTRSFGYEVTFVDDMTRSVPSAPSKVTMVGDPARLAHVIKLLNERKTPLTYLQTMPQFLDIQHKYVNKGRALQRLAQRLGIPMRRVMAVGDYYNDVDMFKAAGLSVAMGNAPLEVRQAADLVAPANDEGGAAWAVMRALNGVLG